MKKTDKKTAKDATKNITKQIAKNTTKRVDKKINKNDKEFVITRLFNAPQESVFKAWTDARHMEHWFGPNDFQIPLCRMDVRPGGAYRIVMRSKDDVDYALKGVYKEVVAPKRIVMTQDTSEHPAEWKDIINPDRKKEKDNLKDDPVGEILLDVEFEKRDWKTKLTIRMSFESSKIKDAMVKLGMAQGWGQSLDRLDKCLSNFEMVELYTF